MLRLINIRLLEEQKKQQQQQQKKKKKKKKKKTKQNKNKNCALRFYPCHGITRISSINSINVNTLGLLANSVDREQMPYWHERYQSFLGCKNRV